ncbi:MAG TPA: phage tail tip lysozyme [Polyangiaceae bacterium]|jgi:MYXO-CTERM domain-containing protein
MQLGRATWIATLALALGCALGGCSSSENFGESDEALFTNDKAAYDFFVGKGLTNFQAAGIVGNLDQESGVNPNSVQQGGPGRGIAQWSAGGRWDTDSGDNAVAYASKQGQSVYSLTLQLDFIWYELTTFSGYGLSKLKATTNVTDATVVFQDDFEGCGQCIQSQRVAYAQAVLNAYGSVAYAATFVSQSFPYASTTMTMTQGDVVASYIELKNTGTKTWNSSTRIGTTVARDRTSAFADSSWVAPNRASAVQGTVAPGATYKFKFNLAATKVGTFDEHFGVVQEGVAWFSDSGQGGPPDDQLEVKIKVVASDGGVEAPDAGDAGKPKNEDAGPVVEKDGGPAIEEDGGVADPGPPGGCSVGPTRGASSSPFGALALVGLALVATRRRRTR